jgi:hypothetical protein
MDEHLLMPNSTLLQRAKLLLEALIVSNRCACACVAHAAHAGHAVRVVHLRIPAGHDHAVDAAV